MQKTCYVIALLSTFFCYVVISFLIRDFEGKINYFDLFAVAVLAALAGFSFGYALSLRGIRNNKT